MKTEDSKTRATQASRTLPSMVRLTPLALGQLAGHTGAAAKGGPAETGLLWGDNVHGVLTVKAVKFFAKARLDTEFESIVSQIQIEESDARLQLLGWAVALESSPGHSENEFFNQRFRRISDVLLVLLPGETGRALELYSRAGRGLFSEANRRSTTTSLPGEAGIAGRVLELHLRQQVDESFYLRTYELRREDESANAARRWMAVLRLALPWKRPEESSLPEGADRLPSPENPKTVATRSLPEIERRGPAPAVGAPQAVAASEPAVSASPSTAPHVLPAPAEATALVPDAVIAPLLQRPPRTVPTQAPEAARGAAASSSSAVSEIRASQPLPKAVPPVEIKPATGDPSGAQPPTPSEAPAANEPKHPVASGSLKDGERVERHDARTAVPRAESAKVLSGSEQRGRRWVWPLAIGVIVAVFTVMTAYLISIWSRNSANGRSVVWRAVEQQPKIGLQITGAGDRLLLTWDRNDPAIQKATAATLRIRDGERQQTISLTPDEITGGSIVYRPKTGDVLFRLEVKDAQGRTSYAVIQSVDGMSMAAPDVRDTRPAEPARSREGQPGGAKPATPAAPVAALRGDVARMLGETRRAMASTAKASTLRKISAESARPGLREAGQVSTADIGAASAAPASSGAPAETSQEVQAPVNPPVAPPPSPAVETHPLSQAPAGNATPPPASLLSYVPARPLRQVVPQPRGSGVMLYRDTDVAVQVKVDATGRVVAAEVVRNGASASLSLESVALNAARDWRFEPARLRGQPVASDYTIRFQFHRNRY